MKRFRKQIFPLLLIVIPIVWLILIVFFSLRLDNVADKQADHFKISRRSFLSKLAKRIRDTLFANNKDIKNRFQIEDELIRIAREKEEKLENLMKIDTLEETKICKPCLNQDLHFGDNPISDLNPFLTRVKSEDKHLINEKDREFQLRGGTKNKPEVKEYGAEIVEKLSLIDLAKYKTGLQQHKFNEFVSSIIPLNRSLPDFRNQACKDKRYDQQLPAVTIIICFHNEAWSTLLRTIHSAINRAPGNLIQEVLLVDDNSNLDHLKEDLAVYLKRELPLVRLIRSDVRLGLVRARMLAVKNATASVLVFLDSHIECFEGWLEPLLTPLLDDSNTIVTPVIDSINHNTFGVANTGEGMVGVLNLSKLMFDWSKAPKRILDLRQAEDDYYMSPIMAGGLFSIYKDYFIKLGGYDEQVQLWGSGNLELSFKTWMCGGRIIITPCSHIAHVFRLKSPYLNRNQRDILIRNKARIADVWLDDYKKFFYSLENIDLDDISDLTVQKKLREDLKCNNFEWYIKHIYPEMYIPGTGPWFGEIINDGFKYCLKINRNNLTPALSDCDETSNPWDSTSINEIRLYNMCLDGSKDGQLQLAKCTGDQTSQVFIHTDAGFIYHQQSKLCLTSAVGIYSVSLRKCFNSIIQTWSWRSNPNYLSWL